MSDEVVIPRKLLSVAVEVALQAPLRQSRGYAANIPWTTVNALRAELEAVGIDWRKVHRQNPKNKP